MAVYERERQKARELYLQSAGEMSLNEIARQVERPASTIRFWKFNEGWERLLHDKPVPAPYPVIHHGLYGVPKKVQQIMEESKGLDEKTLLWEVILYQYTAIVRAQELMYVRDVDDTRFLARRECGEEDTPVAYEPHAAWDRHAAFMQAQSRAVAAFCNSLRVYRQLALCVHTADARAQQAKLQKANTMEKRPPEIHIHTQIPRPDKTNKAEL